MLPEIATKLGLLFLLLMSFTDYSMTWLLSPLVQLLLC